MCVCEGAVLQLHCESNRTPQNQPCMRCVRLRPCHSLTHFFPTPPHLLTDNTPPENPPATTHTRAHAHRCGMKV